MTMSDRGTGAPRFVAYSTLTREPVLADADTVRLLAETRQIPALGFDNRFVEVLDCGETGPDAATVTMRLDAAREVFRTVFRGHGTLSRPGMPAFPLVDLVPATPDRMAGRSVEQDLAGLVERARMAHLPQLASILDRALVQVRAEIERQMAAGDAGDPGGPQTDGVP